MYTYKIIIFDLDGTLFKTDTVFIDAVLQTCISRGIEPIDKERVLKLIGKTSKEVCRELFGEDLSEEEIENIRSEIRANESKVFPKAAQLYAGVKDMLDSLKNEGYTLGICTNGSREYVDKILDNFDIGKYFQIIKSGTHGLEKFQLIKQILDENAVSSVIMIGDTSLDFEAAYEVRCISIGVSYGYGKNRHDDFDFIVDKPEDIYRTIKKINGIYKEIAVQILNRKQSNKPIIVGINGVDTSGKSTFTKELERYLIKFGFKSKIISIDDFHNPSHIRNMEKDPVTSYLNNAFDVIKIENELMKPIVNYGIVDKELLLLDLEKDEFTNHKRFFIDKDTIVLFEGVLLYREPLNLYFDLRIFIDISFDEVLKRAAKRDAGLFGDAVAEKYKNKYIPIQKRYIEKYDPKEISDIIIDNNDYWNPQIIKQPDLENKKNECIELKEVEQKYLYEIGKMLQEDEARKMLGVISLPALNDYKGRDNISKVIVSESNEFIGIIELFNISWRNRRGELSIAIKPEMRRKGYGYAAINQILEIAFLELGMNRVWLRVIETNTKAINLYKKIGFVQEGICRDESLRKGQFINQIQMSILAREWIGMAADIIQSRTNL